MLAEDIKAIGWGSIKALVDGTDSTVIPPSKQYEVILELIDVTEDSLKELKRKNGRTI